MRTDGCRIEAPELKPEEPAYIYLTREARSCGSVFPTPSAFVEHDLRSLAVSPGSA